MNNQLAKKSFIFSFEGIEGSGKTTQIELLKKYFENMSYTVLCLREPGGTEFGENLRSAILESTTPIHPLAEAHLFAASRAQLLAEKILPFMQVPKRIVLLDRYIDSSIAYQGIARELGVNTILDIHAHPPLNLMPHKTFYLEIDLKTSLDRQELRGNEKDYFEKEKENFYHKLIEGFNICTMTFPNRIQKINAIESTTSVHKQILEVINNEYKL